LVADFSAFSVATASMPSTSGIYIDNDEIRGIGAEQLNALSAIKRNRHFIGAVNQQLRQNLGDDHFVVYNQDMFFANRKTSECDSPNREDNGRLSTDTTRVIIYFFIGKRRYFTWLRYCMLSRYKLHIARSDQTSDSFLDRWSGY